MSHPPAPQKCFNCRSLYVKTACECVTKVSNEILRLEPEGNQFAFHTTMNHHTKYTSNAKKKLAIGISDRKTKSFM